MAPALHDDVESILIEAHRLTHGDRNKAYGHPLDDYTRTAAMVSAMLAHVLKRPLTPHEMALTMVCVKLSRETHSPKRDNLVDAAGYAWVARACLEEAERRASPNKAAGINEAIDRYAETSPPPAASFDSLGSDLRASRHDRTPAPSRASSRDLAPGAKACPEDL